MNKYNNIVYDGLTKMAEDAVDKFYSYHSNTYDFNRMGDLYNAYKVVVNDDIWAMYLGDEYMKYDHHQSNEIIYNNAFVEGYHGGSWGKSDYFGFTPPSGEPYYRGPGGEGGFVFWTYKAAQEKKSPRDMIIEQDPKGYIDLQSQLAIEEYEDVVNKYIDKVYECIDSIL